MNNLLSYCGLTDWRMSSSDTDLPVNQGPLDKQIKFCGEKSGFVDSGFMLAPDKLGTNFNGQNR